MLERLRHGGLPVGLVSIDPAERARLRAFVSQHLRDHLRLTESAEDLDEIAARLLGAEISAITLWKPIAR